VVYQAKSYPVGDLEYELNVWGMDRVAELAPWMTAYAARNDTKKVG